jgi:hypothetical protein
MAFESHDLFILNLLAIRLPGYITLMFGVGLASLVLGLIGLGSLGFLRRAFACAFALALAFAFAFAVLISLWTLSRSFSLAFVAS